MSRKIFNLTFICFLILASITSSKAITVDEVTNFANFTLGGARTPITIPHNIDMMQEVLYVGVSNNRTDVAIPTITGCTLKLPPTGTVTQISYTDGTVTRSDFEPLTRSDNPALDTILSPNGCTSVEMFRLKNPPTGNGTLTVNIPAGGDYLVIGVISFIGVDSSTSPTGALVPAFGTSKFPTVTVPTPFNGIVLDTVAAEYAGQDIFIQPSNTDQFRQWRLLSDPSPPPPFYVGAGSLAPINGATSVTMEWEISNSVDWALGATAIKEASSASPSEISGQVFTKAGDSLVSVLVTVQNLETGEIHQTYTNEKGRYMFEGLEVANLYQVSVSSFLYEFSPDNQVFQLTEGRDDVDFVAVRRNRKIKNPRSY